MGGLLRDVRREGVLGRPEGPDVVHGLVAVVPVLRSRGLKRNQQIGPPLGEWWLADPSAYRQYQFVGRPLPLFLYRVNAPGLSSEASRRPHPVRFDRDRCIGSAHPPDRGSRIRTCAVGPGTTICQAARLRVGARIRATASSGRDINHRRGRSDSRFGDVKSQKRALISSAGLTSQGSRLRRTPTQFSRTSRYPRAITCQRRPGRRPRTGQISPIVLQPRLVPIGAGAIVVAGVDVRTISRPVERFGAVVHSRSSRPTPSPSATRRAASAGSVPAG